MILATALLLPGGEEAVTYQWQRGYRYKWQEARKWLWEEYGINVRKDGTYYQSTTKFNYLTE